MIAVSVAVVLAGVGFMGVVLKVGVVVVALVVT
jgi:hypothetical protein